MLPEEFISRIKTQPYIDDGRLLEALASPSPVSIRINESKWGKIPIESEEVPWCKNGWYLKQRPSFTLDPLFHGGCYYPQEASGMFTGEVFSQLTAGSGRLSVLDLCAAPGGKSTHLSSLIAKNGFLVANEVIRSRARILADNITRWGLGNTMVTCNDPVAFSGLKGFFDAIIIDAPCSGEGMFRDEIAVREWSVANTILCGERQKRILLDAWPALKEGGVLIYSTCTYNPGENENQMKWLLDTRKGVSLPVDIASYHGITPIEFEGIKGYGFYPGNIRGEGFFISAVRKTEIEIPEGFKRGKLKFSIDLKEDLKKVAVNITGTPGAILREENTLHSIPVTGDEYELLSMHLNIIKNGTALFTEKNMDIIPTHELALSSGLSLSGVASCELPLESALKFMRKENFDTDTPGDGWSIIKYNGVSLGLVKNIGRRVNNYLPVEWRIRMANDRIKTREIIEWT